MVTKVTSTMFIYNYRFEFELLHEFFCKGLLFKRESQKAV